MKDDAITVQTIVTAPIEKVWDCWTKPEHITKWAFAEDDWEAPFAQNDLREGGKFNTVMAAKDGSAKFDLGGTYTKVEEYKLLEYDMNDGRHVRIEFAEYPEGVKVIKTFDPEHENTPEKQRDGWQAILDHFMAYTESLG